MSRVNLDALSPSARTKVEAELAIRMRPEDGSFTARSLHEIIDSDLVVARSRATVSGRTRHGVLMTWPGLGDPQFLAVTKPLWQCLDLPEQAFALPE